jgi:hypothetical protein
MSEQFKFKHQVPAGTRTWYYDTHVTHGVEGLACVSTESHANHAGAGPDETFTGTAGQLTAHLRSQGYSAIEVDHDDAEAACDLTAAWDEPLWLDHMTTHHHVLPYAMQHAHNTGASSHFVHWTRYATCTWTPAHGTSAEPHRWELVSSGGHHPDATYRCYQCPESRTGQQLDTERGTA